MEQSSNNSITGPSARVLRPMAMSLALLASAVSTALGASGDTNRFVALQLKVTATEVTLMQALQFPGKAKPEPKRHGLDYVILTAEGTVVSRGSIENPRLERACTEEQPGTGVLTQSTSTLEEAITVLRLPVDPTADSIEFFKSPDSGASPTQAPQSLGKVSLKTP